MGPYGWMQTRVPWSDLSMAFSHGVWYARADLRTLSNVCEILAIFVSICVRLGESDSELEGVWELTQTDCDWSFCDLDAICECACV